MAELIKADNISIVRKEKAILDNITLSVRSGDFTTIVGPNGAGKSVLLKVLMGLVKADNGHITRLKNLKIGYMPQQLNTNYLLPLSVRGFLRLKKGFAESSFEKIITETGIGDIIDEMLANISSGQLQHVLLARALLGEPEILILDEPAQNLDIMGQLALYELLERVYENYEVSILMVSHDLNLVMASTKQVVCLFHHICCSGVPQQIAQNPEFISLFGTSTQKLVSVYQHKHDHSHAKT